MFKFISAFFMLVWLLGSTSMGQGVKTDQVRLFQSFHRDAPITQRPFVDGGLEFDNFEYASFFKLGARAGLPVQPNFDINAGLHFINFNPDFGDGSSGLSDIWVSGKYRVDNVFREKTSFSAGGFITLPTGSEDVGQSNFNFGAFGAIRHPLDNQLTLTGVLGIDFVEGFDDSRSSSLLFGTGVIYTYDSNLNFIGELQIQSEYDYALLTAGTDYVLLQGGRVRGALGVGLDDGAPDLALMASYLFSFK
jgi:hypothetical protein